MDVVQLPVWRLRDQETDRAALRRGIADSQAVVRLVRALQDTGASAAGYCDRCAAPIEFGAVLNRTGRYCSVECSLEGPPRPA